MKHLDLYPLITEKAALNAEAGTYVFKANQIYSKPEIRNFLEKKFDVKVESVRTAIFSRAQTNKRNAKVSKTYFKKVYVKLQKGMKIPLFEGV
ncbi:MAG: 50S ribosomal protein L23 [Bdellovibrionaceae bacterium]|nr:50S ribosomal protein L23 [Pseudobdellovibrionaceae bacterium]NUM60236.1 50S ribosomal protein L23 [Pseudobdellovibrionaceae bacterium]